MAINSYSQLQQYASDALNQQAQPAFGNAIGSGLGGGLIGGCQVPTNYTITTGTTTTNADQQCYYWGNDNSLQLQPQMSSVVNKMQNKLIEFFRINYSFFGKEGNSLEEPLDELRIKVAKWLKRS